MSAAPSSGRTCPKRWLPRPGIRSVPVLHVRRQLSAFSAGHGLRPVSPNHLLEADGQLRERRGIPRRAPTSLDHCSVQAALYSGVVLRSFFRYGQLAAFSASLHGLARWPAVSSCPEVESFLTSGKVFDLIRLVLILECFLFSAARRFEATPSTPAWMWQRMRGGLKRKWLRAE